MRSALTALAILVPAALLLSAHGAPPEGPRDPSGPGVLVVPAGVAFSMNELFTRNNEHWNELADLTTLEQMLGTIRPTQREYLGCLRGEVARDTVWVTGWAPAENLKQLQFAVDGTCEHVPGLIGTWHTHPYRADLRGRAVKQRELSRIDLATFAAGQDLVTVAVWDVDSLEAAIRRPDGDILHPAPIVVR